MLCERCGRNKATVHITETSGRDTNVYHLCENCSLDSGIDPGAGKYTLSATDMLSFLNVNDIDSALDVKICSACVSSYADFKKTGILGCEFCYAEFEEPLKGDILAYHNSLRHYGKIPAKYVNADLRTKRPSDAQKMQSAENSIHSLRQRLGEAVSAENYEEAAVLRDRIAELSGGKSGGDSPL